MERIILLLISLFVISFYNPLSASSLGSADIKRIYSEIRDIRGNFIQKTYLRDLKRIDTYKGDFFIKFPSRMKWHYRGGKDETEVIIKGQQMILYQKNQRQALRQKFDPNLYGQSPIAILSGLSNIEDDFNIEESEGDLVLKPKKSMGGIVSVILRLSSGLFPIDSLVITDRRSNRIEITLRDVSINRGLPDSLFEFIPPEGVGIHDLGH